MESKKSIRLIATDMDGTLLDDKKQFPPDLSEIVARLKEQGIHFTAASGRSYASQIQSFTQLLGKETAEKMDYICDNGAFIVEGGKVVTIHKMDWDFLRELLKACEGIPDIMILFCGVNGTYHLPYTPIFEKKAHSYYVNNVEVQDLSTVDDDIFKVAICDLRGPQNNIYPALAPLFGETMGLQISGPEWMDVMNPGINKGGALKDLQERLNVSFEETIAFGDFFNDIGLLENAGCSFVMANSHPDMLPKGRYVAKSNVEYGVTEAIRRYVLDGEPYPPENPLFER